MATVTAVWGLDIGQCALKALRLEQTADGSVEVTHFDLIEHPKILTQPDAEGERDQLIQNALDKFLSRNEIGKARVALAVPGQSSFARFVKLPPVEAKRIPEIVKFEAVQQIPFDIDEVEWDYQTFMSERSPEVEVGIFAMRKELVLKHLSHLRAAGIEVDIVQLAPLALYNMMSYDGMTAKTGATILIDVGAANTDLVVSDGDRIWLRSIPLGGNSFTESLVKAFKLPFSKAENLKRTAATSKYARQIFVAMRPVFGDLVSEVQRSIGFYTALHRDATISRVLCLGNAFRLPGLQKYLEQNLQVEAVRPNSFNRLKPSATINAPAFVENLWSFGVTYGLGVQALELGPIGSSLLPFSIARQRSWRAQRPWFAAAAAAMVLGVGAASWSAVNRNAHAEEQQRAASAVAGPEWKAWDAIQQKKTQLKDQGRVEIAEIRDIQLINGYCDVVPQVMCLIQDAVPNEWRAEAVELVRKEMPPGKPVDFRRDVWPKVGTSEFQKRPDVKNRIVLIEQISMDPWVGKPPAAAKTDTGAVGSSPPPSVPSPSGPPPGGQMPGGPPPPPPPGPGGPMGGAMGGPRPTVPGVGLPPGVAAQQVGGDTSKRGVQVVVTGYTNAPRDSADGEDVVSYLRKFLGAMNNRRCRLADGTDPQNPDPLLTQIRLVAPLQVDKVAQIQTLNPGSGILPCWPPTKEAAAPAAAPAAGDAGAPPSGGSAAAGADYPINKFTLVINVQVLPPKQGR